MGWLKVAGLTAGVACRSVGAAVSGWVLTGSNTSIFSRRRRRVWLTAITNIIYFYTVEHTLE